MMFWIIAAVVLVVLFVIAWVTSGRTKPGGVAGRQDAQRDAALGQAELHRTMNINGPPGPPRL